MSNQVQDSSSDSGYLLPRISPSSVKITRRFLRYCRFDETVCAYFDLHTDNDVSRFISYLKRILALRGTNQSPANE